MTAALLQFDVGYRPSVQTLHLGLFVTMTVIALAVGYWIHRTRHTRGAQLFAVTLFLVGLRTGSDVVHGLVGELWTAQAVLVAANPVLELCALVVFVRFAGRYSGVDRVGGERAKRVLGGLVIVAAVATATNPFHGLVVTEFTEVVVPFTHVGARWGVGGYAITGANGLLVLVGAGLLAHRFTVGSTVAWWPAAVLSIAISHVFLVEILQVSVVGLLPLYDYGAIGLGGFVFLTTVALLDHGLSRIEAVARSAVLDVIDDAVVFLDADGTVVDRNPTAQRLFPDVDAGDPFSQQFDEPIGVPREEETSRTEVTIDVPTQGSSREGITGELAGHTGPRDFYVHTNAVRTETGDVLGYAVRFVDVTELKQRTRELQRKNEQLDQFASTLSHDLRNPLNVASGFLEMAIESVESDADVDVESALSYLEKVDVSIDRMNAIIEDILALIEHGDPVTENETVDFEAVATAAWETVDSDDDATLRVASGGTVEADRDRLQRLLENLFRNAVDHVGEDVTVETGLADGSFYVADDGPGIPEEDRDRIFEYGFTKDEEGTGLGLSIVAQLADAHGWDVTLDPSHDGARFVVRGCETTVAETPAPVED